MAKSLYFTAAETGVGTRAIAQACIEKLREHYPHLGVFRTFTNGAIDADEPFLSLLDSAGLATERDVAWGTTRQAYVANEDAAMVTLVKRYTDYAAKHDAIFIVGLLDSDPIYPGMLARTGRAAANLGATVVPVISGSLRTLDEISTAAHLTVKEMSQEHAPTSAIIVSDAPAELTHSLPSDSSHRTIIAFAEGVQRSVDDANAAILVAAMEQESHVVTPLSFTAGLIERARSLRQRIVLPESDDDRVLTAAAELIEREVADIILLGDADAVAQRANALDIDLSKATVISPENPELLEKYATKFAQLRAKKGISYEQALEKVKDISYFGTMMVYMDDADGMVSGAAHTTAHTIVPSFQTIKTKPTVDLVSSCFLMLMEDRVYVYADCAVTPNPTPAELASIAISSAETAQAFGVEPRIAMLSYSTGTSGKGPSVDAVVEATKIAKERRPDLLIEGPIQYDAAVNPAVAEKKLPGSPVAGRATVFVFPDLNAGNIGYKAVQRSSGAVAVGPVLQGLNKPVNDLSRGALVEDIVNTVAITAIQAQVTQQTQGTAQTQRRF
ncbi:MAG: phosphate acetyltransferase [Actinomycetaceae bacterium]|nr:phosphate acetyltransferase [Arcanobacterium sp.]MDD7686623.1 phosphate acetyltransferase [Actinomycetaceae bacterium]MDY5273871.1 phosphate acetyltransferase [Arcanobacterium sp.]